MQRTGDSLPAQSSKLSSSSELEDDQALPFPGLTGDTSRPPPPPQLPTDPPPIRRTRNSTAAKKKAKKASFQKLFTDSEESGDSLGEGDVSSSTHVQNVASRGERDDQNSALISDPLGALTTDSAGVPPAKISSVGPLHGNSRDSVRLVVQDSSDSDSDVEVVEGRGGVSVEFGPFPDADTGGRGSDRVDLLGSAQMIRDIREVCGHGNGI